MDEMIRSELEAFHSGESIRAFRLLGCHRAVRDGVEGWVFRTWAPNAQHVSVVGDFNYWNIYDLPMEKISRGVWEAFSPNPKPGSTYKYFVTGPNGWGVYKMDPYGYRVCALPETSSIVTDLDGYRWKDAAYLEKREQRDVLHSPLNIYEVHLGSWKRHPDGSYYSYRELAEELIPYAKDMGYTHLELMPITEYPYDPSWGYQVSCYYAPTFRYGTPEQFMEFVDRCHRAGLGVIMDWVPAHFPKDEYGLYEFDGTCCYELSDPTMNEHPDWNTRIYDYGKPEVLSFLVSNAVFWLEKYHIDGIRVDAVASMLYLDYNRPNYKPNKYGGKENLEAIEFLRRLNRAAFSVMNQPIMVAEESTAFPDVTRPDYMGGLGFLFKWNMGWMNDSLRYMSLDPIYRKYEHDKLTFSLTYAFSENYVLPLSHDEVVYGKGSLINKMPGYYPDKFCALRAYFGWQLGHPGKKLNFMGGEFAQFIEWNYDRGLDWMLLDFDKHRQMQDYVRDLNKLYLKEPCFWLQDTGWEGFQWISCDDRDNSVVSFIRRDGKGGEIVGICNFCPVKREHYRIGLPQGGAYQLVLNSDELKYGGWGTELTPVTGEASPWGEFAWSGEFTLPPNSVQFYRPKPKRTKKTPGTPGEKKE